MELRILNIVRNITAEENSHKYSVTRHKGRVYHFRRTALCNANSTPDDICLYVSLFGPISD